MDNTVDYVCCFSVLCVWVKQHFFPSHSANLSERWYAHLLYRLPKTPQRWQVAKVVLGLSQLTSVHFQWTSNCPLPASQQNLSASAPQKHARCCREIQPRARMCDKQHASVISCCPGSLFNVQWRLMLVLSFCHPTVPVISVQKWLVQETVIH